MSQDGYDSDLPRSSSPLSAAGRVDLRMLTDGQPITDEQQSALLKEFDDYLKFHGKSRKDAAAILGVSDSVVSEVLRGKYKGDTDTILRVMDSFLAEERKRAEQHDLSDFARIRITEEIFGGLNLGIQLNKMPVIIAPPGACKTMHALAFAAQRQHTFVIRIVDEPADRSIVSRQICETIATAPGFHREMVGMAGKPHPRRMQAIRDFLASHRQTMLIVDEAQKLSSNGLELFRDLHDGSDPTGRRPMPIAFFGDERFLLLINETRRGLKTTKMTAQFSSRMYPILNVTEWATDNGGDYYSVDDILTITRNMRLKLLTPAAARWLTKLSNIAGKDGLLRRAMTVLRAATIFHQGVLTRGERLDTAHLQEAMRLSLGRQLADDVDTLSNGQLLRKTA